jgi:hypothetical protein
MGPTTLSLNWNSSNDTCFRSYLLQVSSTSSSGPWSNIDSISRQQAGARYVNNLGPGTTSWWRIVNNNCIGSTAGPALAITQPVIAALNVTHPSPTSATLNWTNSAQYGGKLAFFSYSVMESVSAGSYSLATTISSVASRTFTLTGLAPTAGYQFYINTTDFCGGCNLPYPSSSLSNTVGFGTTSPLAASARATPFTSDVGQPVSLICAVAGGVGPFTFAWNLGDGANDTGATTSHTYSIPGTVTPICTVTDSSSGHANAPTSVTVSTDPTVAPLVPPPAPTDTGVPFFFSTNASGGSGGYVYSWSGLPPGCIPPSTNSVTCGSTAVGVFYITAGVSDSNGFSFNGPQVALTVVADPVVQSITATPTSFLQGAPVGLAVNASGGTGSYRYAYTGLPGGCSSVDSPWINCTPGASGKFTVVVAVTDAAGFTATGQTNLTIAPALFGLSQPVAYSLIGMLAAAILVAAVAVALVSRRRRRQRLEKVAPPLVPPPPDPPMPPR